MIWLQFNSIWVIRPMDGEKKQNIWMYNYLNSDGPTKITQPGNIVLPKTWVELDLNFSFLPMQEM